MSFFGSIYADPDLPHRARTVYMYLRVSPRTVQRALNDLEHAGYIERQQRYRENGSRTSNLYIIIEGK